MRLQTWRNTKEFQSKMSMIQILIWYSTPPPPPPLPLMLPPLTSPLPLKTQIRSSQVCSLISNYFCFVFFLFLYRLQSGSTSGSATGKKMMTTKMKKVKTSILFIYFFNYYLFILPAFFVLIPLKIKNKKGSIYNTDI